MKNSVLCVMVLGTLLLAGCGSKSDANVKNLSEATNAYLAKKGQLCLGIVHEVAGRPSRKRSSAGNVESIGDGGPGESWFSAFPRNRSRIHDIAALAL